MPNNDCGNYSQRSPDSRPRFGHTASCTHILSVESGGTPYWRLVARLAVIPWSLPAHSNRQRIKYSSNSLRHHTPTLTLWKTEVTVSLWLTCTN
jgi:hypothetical protein